MNHARVFAVFAGFFMLAAYAVLPASQDLRDAVSPDTALGEIDASDVRPQAGLQLVDVKGVEVQSGQASKPEGGGEEGGDQIDVEDPCPNIIGPLWAASRVSKLRAKSVLSRDSYHVASVRRLGGELEMLMAHCQNGNMRAIKDAIDSVRRSAVYAKGQPVPEGGAVNKGRVDALMDLALRLIYRFDPHLDPKDRRTMDPYR